MCDDPFERFRDHVCDERRGLWPRWKSNRVELQNLYDALTRTCPGMTTTDLCGILTRLHAETPGSSPPWKAIFAEVKRWAADLGSSKANEFQQFLDRYRRLRRAHGMHDVPDSGLWDMALTDASREIQVDTVSGRPYPDPDGRRAHLASETRNNFAASWIRWHREKGLDAPAFLEADMRTIPELVADCRRDGQPVPTHIAAYLVRIGQAEMLDGADVAGEAPVPAAAEEFRTVGAAMEEV